MKTLILLIALLLISISAKAATYNFYFNNTEQGANSSASPSVTVQDGKMVAPGTGTDALPTESPAIPAAPPAPQAEANSSVASAPAPMESTFPDAKWKFSLGSIKTTYTDKRSDSPNYYGPYSSTDVKFMGSLTYYPIREAGFSFHVGRFLGPELEVNPFGVKTGWGKMQFGLMLALLKDTVGYEAEDEFGFGGSWVDSSASRSSSFDSEPVPMPTVWRHPIVHKKPINIYTGAQVGINLVRDLSLNLAYRIAPFEQNDRMTSALHWSANYLF